MKIKDIPVIKGYVPLHQDGKTLVMAYWENKKPRSSEFVYGRPSSPSDDIEWIPVVTMTRAKYNELTKLK